MDKPPWIGERPVDPENCVYDPPNLATKISWPIKKRRLLWKATRHVAKRYADRNNSEILDLLRDNPAKLMQKLNNERAMVATEEVFGLGDIFCKAMQLDRSLCACINDYGHKA